MSYNKEDFPHYVRTAGKITLVTAFAGLLVFLVAFMFDVGTQEFNRVSAQTATTTLTVLNTPPAFTLDPYEVVGSATTTPTNSGSVIQWSAIGTDSNGAPYFLLVCSTNASPTANAASGPSNLGSAPPDCGVGAVQWGVSASTTSGALATVSTTTVEGGQFSTSSPNVWYAWVCDDDPNNPRCNSVPSQGLYSTSSSPFHVNSRPVFTGFGNNGPKDPGANITFYSTSSDPDTLGGDQNIYLVVCSTNTDYNPTTNTCSSNFIASTTISLTSDASATKTLASILRDDTYAAYGYIVDQYGHEAAANPINFDFDVNNVAPTVLGGDITLNAGSALVLTEPGGETTGFTLDFTLRDANSCLNAASSSEFAVVPYTVSVFRSSYGTTTCTGAAGSYDPNYCYPSGIATTTWNLSCTATTTCASPNQDYMDYTCTFPLWFVADPTDAGPNTPAAYSADNWSVGVAGRDDDALSGVMSTTSNAQELNSASYIGIANNAISYGGIEPGDNSGTLSAISTTINLGNTGLDQEVIGESMCGTFAIGNECPTYATSTIPEWRQQFSTTTYSYDSDATEGGGLLNPNILQLSSSTQQELELNINKSTSTSTPQVKDTYWGIAVPIAITLAGSYQGLNTFYAVTADAIDW
jgi:hypothetical protein